MRPRLFLIPLLLSSAACTPAEDYDDAVGVQEKPQKQASAASPDAEKSAEAGKVRVENEFYTFEYAWPAEAAAIAPLTEILRKRADTAQKELEKYAREDSAAAAEAEFEYRPHEMEVEWERVADTPGWLSMSAMVYTYTGGAHPNYVYDSLVWDKQAGVERDPTDLFRSAGALGTALGGPFCAQLNAERAKRRGSPVDPASDDSFSKCPDIDELTVLLGSSNGTTFDRIGLLAAPYIAGPYAEGSYEFTLPVTTAVLDAVKPEYRKAFALGTRNSAR